MAPNIRKAVTAILLACAAVTACSESTGPGNDDLAVKAAPTTPEKDIVGGPQVLPPGGADVATAGDRLRAGGQTITYSGIDLSQIHRMVWGENTGNPSALALDGTVSDANELLTFQSTDADLIAGRIIWTGQSHLVRQVLGVPASELIQTRLTVTVTIDGTTAIPLNVADGFGYGVPSTIGAFATVGFSTFQANVLFEGTRNGTAWVPIADLFDQVSGADVSQIVPRFAPVFYTSLFGPSLSADAATHDFGTLVVGHASPGFDVTLTNTGTAAVSPTISVAGSNSADFVATSACGLLNEDESCTVSLVLTPSGVGSRTAQLDVAYGGEPVAVELTGTGEAAVAVVGVSPTGLAYGLRNLGTTTSLSLTITNTGTGNFIPSGYTIGGENSSDFLIPTTACTTAIAPGASCTLTVQYIPTDVGSRSATLTITGNAPSVLVPLTGGGHVAQAIARTSISAITFPALNIGVTSSPATFQITNTGDANLVITTLNMLGDNPLDFTAGAPCIEQVILPNNTCVVTVRFTPTAGGFRSASVSIVSNAAPSAVGLSGTGNTPVLHTTSTGIVFASALVGVEQRTAPFGIQNTGTGPLTVTDMDFTGTGADDYSVQTISCVPNGLPVTIQPGSICNITLLFRPTAAGARPATLVIQSNGGQANFTVNGTGTAVVTRLNTSPATAMNFPSALVGLEQRTLTLVLANGGNTPLTVTDLDFTGPAVSDYSIQTITCNGAPDALPLTLQVGTGSCNVTLIFRPTAAGSRAATLAITSAAGQSVLALTGTGTAVTPVIHLSPVTAVNFGGTLTGQTLTQNLTITNTGNAPLTVTDIDFTGPAVDDYQYRSILCNGITDALPLTIQQNAGSCVVTVAFTPSIAGSRTATLAISSNGGQGVVTLNGTGINPTPAIQVPSGLSFGSALAGLAHNTASFAIQSTGNGALTISSIDFSGVAADDYAVQSMSCGTTPVTLPPFTGGCGVTVVFSPSVPGTRSANLIVHSNVGQSTVMLTGTGLQPPPGIGLNTGTLDFGSPLIGLQSTRNFTVSSTGLGPLTVSSLSFTDVGAPDYGVESVSCGTLPVAMAPSTTCVVTLRFRPTASGPRPGTLVIQSDAGQRTIALTGVGVQPTPHIQFPTSVSFAPTRVGQSSFFMIAIGNSGNGNLAVTGLNINGSNASEFSVGSQTCTTGPVVPLGSCAIQIIFTPTGINGSAASLTLVNNSDPAVIQLQGTGTGEPGIGVSGTTLTFPTLALGSQSPAQSVSISSTGNLPLHITSASISGVNSSDFNMTGNTCGAPVAPATSCTISIRFSPSAGGTRNGTLEINSDAGARTVSLTGAGIPPADLALNMSASVTTAKAGRPITYTLGVGNYGPGTATELTVTDVVPANTTFGSLLRPPGVSCTVPPVGATGTIVCRVSSLSNGGAFALILTVNVLSATKTTVITNTATVSSGSLDLVPANNSASISLARK